MTMGFGGPEPNSSQQRALASIDARKQDFVNKDFVKNIQWLNESVTYMSATMGSMQKGIDQANQNILEEISGFISDMLVMFAGFEPTGIDFGDLKYVFQGIGALLGINPDTPFPLNLAEAAWNMFSEYIFPLPQFTDLIFDALAAWAEELGFTDEAVDAITEFNDAVVDLYNGIDDVFGELGSILSTVLEFFGLGHGSSSTDPLHELWEAVTGFVNDIIEGPRDLLLNVLSSMIVVLFKSLTWVVKMINPDTWLKATGLQFVGGQLAPEIADSTEVWSVGSNPATQWVFDATQSHGGSAGSFKTNGSGTNKRLLTQEITPCVPGHEYQVRGQLKWNSIPTNTDTFGPCIVFYSGANEISQTNVNAAGGHGATGGWALVSQDVIVPQNVDGFKIGCRITSSVNTGTVWVDEISCVEYQGVGTGVSNFFTSLLPWSSFQEFLDGIFGGVGNTIPAVASFLSQAAYKVVELIQSLFGGDNILATILSSIIPGLDATKITSGTFSQNMITGLISDLASLVSNIAAKLSTTSFNDLLNSLFGQPNILSNILSSLIPSLDATKITTGTFPMSQISGLITELANKLGLNSLINAFNLTGLIRPQQIGLVPDAVTGTNTNLVIAGSFDTASSVPNDSGWSWDNTQDHTGNNGGSAKVVADGINNEMVANEIHVIAGQNINISVWVKYQSLSYSGSTPLTLGITEYKYNPLTGVSEEINAVDVSPHTPSGATAGWLQISGSYVVPTTGNIPNEIRVRLSISSALTSGTVWWDDVSAIKPDPGGVIPGIGTVVNHIVNGLEDLAHLTPWTFDDQLVSLISQRMTTTDLSTRVTILESLNTAGQRFSDEFNRVGIGSNWDITYSGGGAGSWNTDGAYAKWNESGFGDVEFIARYNAATHQTNTDTQGIYAILGSKGEHLFFPLLYDELGHIDLYGRMSDDRTNWMRVRFRVDGYVTIHRCLSSTVTQLNSTTLSSGPGASNTIGFLCGTSLGTRYFSALINGAEVLAASDSTSAIGAGNRGAGHGGRIEGAVLCGQASCAKLNSWVAIDA